jgi:hypothetical protein
MTYNTRWCILAELEQEQELDNPLITIAHYCALA